MAPLGAAIGLYAWFYLSGFVILVGGEINFLPGELRPTERRRISLAQSNNMDAAAWFLFDFGWTPKAGFTCKWYRRNGSARPYLVTDCSCSYNDHGSVCAGFSVLRKSSCGSESRLEGLLCNVPDDNFTTDYEDCFVNAINRIQKDGDKSKLVCANEQYTFCGTIPLNRGLKEIAKRFSMPQSTYGRIGDGGASIPHSEARWNPLPCTTLNLQSLGRYLRAASPW
jgi:hypothetical protein